MKKYKPEGAEILELRDSRDAMHEDLLRLLKLNRYDVRFLTNINNKYIKVGKPLSTSQNEVYEKILFKYRKQLRRLSAPYKRILELPWRNGILTPDELRQKTFFRFVKVDDKLQMELFFPYKEEYKQQIRAIIHDDACEYLNIGAVERWRSPGNQYDFRWYPDEKLYRGPFNVYLFRNLYNWCVEHDIVIDSYVQEIVDQFNKYGTKEEWSPHLHIVHNRLYICGAADSMIPELENIDMTDTSLANIERVCKLGLKPPKLPHNIEGFMAPNAFQGVDASSIADVRRLLTYLEKTGRKALWLKPSRLSRDAKQSEVFREMTHNSVGLLENLNWNSLMVDIDQQKYRDKPMDDIEAAVDKAREKGYNTVVVNMPLDDVMRSQSYLGKIAMEADKLIYLQT